MLAIDLIHVILLMSMTRSLSSTSINSTKFRSRKISGGDFVSYAVRYMVYLIQAEYSKTQYDAWICGGAIVSNEFIVTSAACVEDVQYMYAISGYTRYVNSEEMNKDECASASKKKIVYICVPKRYDFAYDKIQKWALIDIAAVKVESPYSFYAPKLRGCSWIPDKIDINYEAIYQASSRDTVVLGFGHSNKWRSKNDPKDYNQDLRYVSLKIMNKVTCKNMYSKTPELLPIIDRYMICAMNEGNLDEEGNFVKRVYSLPAEDGCARKDGSKCEETFTEEKSDGDTEYVIPYNKPEVITRTLNKNQKENEEVEDKDIHVPATTNTYDHTEKQTTEKTPDDDNISFEDILNVRRAGDVKIFNYTRKVSAGICQNDHGGPLVTWVGKRERLIGVASVFRLNKNYSCIGPSLFTSTQCNSGFLHCVISEPDKQNRRKHFKNTSLDDIRENIDNLKTNPEDAFKDIDNPDLSPDDAKGNNDNIMNRQNKSRRSDFCDLPPKQKGFDVVERRISWKNHPDGPADNEVNYG